MIKKLRIKFIIINMVIVSVILSILLGFIVLSTKQNLENDSIRMMRNIAREPRHYGDIRGRDDDDMRLPFLIISYGLDGNLTAKGGYYDLSDTETIEYLYDTAIETSKEIGIIEQYDLRFVRTWSPMGDVVVFSDITNERIVLRGIIRDCLIVGTIALGGFFVISILLARWAVRPVEEAWNQQRQFVADASHDLKTPLTVILTDAELLQQKNCSDENRLKLADAISKMAMQMKGLVVSMLELASVEKDSENLVLSEVRFSETVNNACLTMEPLFFEKNLSLKAEVDDGVVVKGNESELSNLLSVLLDNAMKYSTPGTETEVRLEKQAKGCRLKVSNCGEEIPENMRTEIFKRFYRADKSRSMNQSYGLGLSIASQIVSNHNGEIWCESENGINSFIVKL